MSTLVRNSSRELFRVRNELKSSENLLCVCSFDPENTWQVYSPTCDRWLTLPLLPSPIRHLAHFGAVTTSGKLFVLGGGSDAVDPLTGDHDGTFAPETLREGRGGIVRRHADLVWCTEFPNGSLTSSIRAAGRSSPSGPAWISVRSEGSKTFSPLIFFWRSMMP